MKRRQKATLALPLLLCIAAPLTAQVKTPSAPKTATPRPKAAVSAPKATLPDVEMKDFLPAGAVNPRKFTVDFTHNGSPADTVLTYQSINSDDPDNRMTTVRILHYTADTGWKVAFEKSYDVENESSGEAIGVHEMVALNGKRGLFVLQKASGVGSAATWEVVAFADGKFMSLDPAEMINRVLEGHAYQDLGHNTVDAKRDLIVDVRPGYSPRAEDCCPDSPSLQITVKFNGSSLDLVSTKTLPLTPQKK
jgi:hypothetical protein